MNAIVPASIDGEVILPGDCITVRAALHPLKTSHVTVEVPVGLTLAEIVERVQAESGEVTCLPHGLVLDLLTELGCERIPPEHWSRVRAKAGVTVVIRAVPGQGGGGLFKTILSVALIAVSLAAPFIAPLIGVSAAAIGGVAAVGMLGLNVLFPARPAQLKSQKTRTSYSISAGNSADLYGPVPSILGRMRVFPKYAAPPYTEFVGADQYLRMLFCWGYGPLDITDIKIGETPITDYEGVEIETFFGYPTDGKPTLYPSTVIQEDLSIDLVHTGGVRSQRTTASDTTEIACDFVWPQGLIEVSNKKGKRSSRSASIQVRYRASGSSDDWTVLANLNVTAKTQDVIRRSVRGVVPKGQYDVDVYKTSGDYTGDDRTVAEQVTWTALKSMRNEAPLAFPYPLAITALRIKATGQLNGVIQNINGICTSRVTAFDEATETWIEDTPSQNPADLYRWVLQNPASPEQKADDEIDLPALERWHAYNTTEGFAFNQVRDFVASPASVLDDVSSAGRGMRIMRDGLFSVVWDEPTSDIVQTFTPRNSWGFQGVNTYKKTMHGLRVPFINEDNGWQDDERTVYDDGFDKSNATRLQQVEFPGVTDPDLIWKHGRFHLAQVKLRPATYKLSVDVENLICTRGDRVRVNHDVPMFGLVSGRVKAVSADGVVTLDERVLMDPDKTYAIRCRSVSMSRYFTVTTVDGYTNEVSIGDVANPPMPDDLFTFGEAGQESVILKVLSISPGDDLTADMTFVDDAPAISQADEGEIPPYDSQISVPVNPATIRPSIVDLDESSTPDGLLPLATLIWRAAPTTSPVRYEIIKRFDDGSAEFGASEFVDAPLDRISWVDLDPGNWTFRVRALFRDGSSSSWAELQTYVLSTEQVPPDVQNLLINILGDQATFTWDAPAEPVAWLELRHASVLVDASWQTATPIVLKATGQSVQVPMNTGTFLAKFVSGSYVYSANAAEVIVSNSGITTMNAVEEVVEESPFMGVHDDTYEAEGAIRLLYLQDFFAYEDFFAIEDIFLGPAGIASEGTYTFANSLDLLQSFTSRVSAEITAYGVALNDNAFAVPDMFAEEDAFGVDPASWTLSLEMRTTEDDPTDPDAVWSSWRELVVGDYTARAFQFRVVLESLVYGVTPAVERVRIKVDMPDRLEVQKDVTVPVEGLPVVFSPAFLRLKGLLVTAQDLNTGDYLEITGKDENGFTLAVKDKDGNPVARTADWQAVGYGRRMAA